MPMKQEQIDLILDVIEARKAALYPHDEDLDAKINVLKGEIVKTQRSFDRDGIISFIGDITFFHDVTKNDSKTREKYFNILGFVGETKEEFARNLSMAYNLKHPAPQPAGEAAGEASAPSVSEEEILTDHFQSFVLDQRIDDIRATYLVHDLLIVQYLRIVQENLSVPETEIRHAIEKMINKKYSDELFSNTIQDVVNRLWPGQDNQNRLEVINRLRALDNRESNKMYLIQACLVYDAIAKQLGANFLTAAAHLKSDFGGAAGGKEVPRKLFDIILSHSFTVEGIRAIFGQIEAKYSPIAEEIKKNELFKSLLENQSFDEQRLVETLRAIARGETASQPESQPTPLQPVPPPQQGRLQIRLFEEGARKARVLKAQQIVLTAGGIPDFDQFHKNLAVAQERGLPAEHPLGTVESCLMGVKTEQRPIETKPFDKNQNIDEIVFYQLSFKDNKGSATIYKEDYNEYKANQCIVRPTSSNTALDALESSILALKTMGYDTIELRSIRDDRIINVESGEGISARALMAEFSRRSGLKVTLSDPQARSISAPEREKARKYYTDVVQMPAPPVPPAPPALPVPPPPQPHERPAGPTQERRSKLKITSGSSA